MSCEKEPKLTFRSIFWANSGLGVVTLPDFWSTIHKGDVTIVRDELDTLEKDTLHFKTGRAIKSDYLVTCTGWGDHFAMFDDELKLDVGLPVQEKSSFKKDPTDRDWKGIDREADLSVNRKLPFLAKGPVTKTSQARSPPQRHWRLYRRVVPLSHAERGDRSLAIMGQIHTVQTPLVAEMQSFWAILYLLGEIKLPPHDTMVKEIAEWNAWTRKRYVGQGRKFPYSLYDFLPVSSYISPAHICPCKLQKLTNRYFLVRRHPLQGPWNQFS